MDNFNHFETKVRSFLTAAPSDVIEEINSSEGTSLIRTLYDKGFSIPDAVAYLKLTSQTLDEQVALSRMDKLARKYNSNVF